MPPVMVTTFSGDWPLPSPSPFCLKLLTWLRMAEIPHIATDPKGPPRSKTGKVPYITRADGSLLADSQVIADTLTREYAIGLDSDLTDDERSRALLIRRLVEDHLYFATLAVRWLDERHWAEVKRAYFGTLPVGVRLLVPWFVRRKVRRDTYGHGVGRRELYEVYDSAVEDLDALACLLGDQDWFVGVPSSIDACVFGALENIRSVPLQWPGQVALQRHPNLLAFLDRTRERYWGDDWPGDEAAQ